MNLVMIGRFKDAVKAAQAKEVIDRLTERVNTEIEDGQIQIGMPAERFPDGILDLLRELGVYLVGPAELEQFAYDVHVRVEHGQVVITTDEVDVSAFLKLLVDRGARVEVYSAHDYPDSEYGRGK